MPISTLTSWNGTTQNMKLAFFISSGLLHPEHSIAKTTGIRKIDEANKIVLKTIEIIKYLKHNIFLFKSPQSGLLKKQPIMGKFEYNDAGYCKYGMPYRKRTRLWNNLENFKPNELCEKHCGNVRDGKHIATAQRMPNGKKGDWSENARFFKQDELLKFRIS